MHKIIINLPNRPERLIHTLDQLRKVNLSDFIILFEAKTPEYAKSNFHRILDKDAYRNIINTISTTIMPNFNAVACAISHINCWKYIIDNNLDECLIIEDDIEFNDPELFKIEYYRFIERISSFDNNHLFVTFGSKIFPCNFDRTPYRNYESYKKPSYDYNGFDIIKNPFTGLHFYYLNKSMAKFLYSNIKRLKYQIDLEIGILAAKYFHFGQYNDFKFRNFNSIEIKQSNKFKSDIQYHPISIEELKNIFDKIPSGMVCTIYNYIPNCYKINRLDENHTIYQNNEANEVSRLLNSEPINYNYH
jgi:GR25 family glycosyltransferase involved in LPS biosynthesis